MYYKCITFTLVITETLNESKMYFHDLTFGKEMKAKLAKEGISVNYIQAEHKIGRIRISLAYDFSNLDALISIITMHFHDLGSEWRFKGIQRLGKSSGFTDPYSLVEFKEIITINHP